LKLSLDWIREFVNLESIQDEEIIQKINESICETEEVYQFLPHLENIVPVEIVEILAHPQADRLKVARVLAGDRTLQIVTHSDVLSPGNMVPCALPGALLKGTVVQNSELRGVRSEGMFCTGKDIGVNEDESEVFILNDSSLPLHTICGNRSNLLNIEDCLFQTGNSISHQLGFSDTIIEIDNKSITHRPDLWSHFGFARELAAQFGRKILKNPLDTIVPDSEFNESYGKLEVTTTPYAKSYYAISINRIQVAGSRMKYRSRLLKCGIKSISNVVDVSNYVLLEIGQPTHFFDKKKLSNNFLQVAPAVAGETICLLDDTERNLSEGIGLIRNGDAPVAIAGIMGGKDTAVSEDTTEVVLESAVFHRESIRAAIRKTGIRSESAIRYEKGLDTATCIPVIHRCIHHLKENGNRQIQIGSISGFDHEKDKKVTIQTHLNFIKKKIGKEISAHEVEDILNRLGFHILEKLETKENVHWNILVPRYRHNYDVTIPEDLVEEVGRTIGYSTIATKPLQLSLETPVSNPMRNLEKKIRIILSLHSHYSEVYNYSFQSLEDARFEKDIPDSEIVFLTNEMPQEYSVLRTSIYPSLLRNAATNQERFEEFGIYEIARTYDNSLRNQENLPKEWRKLGILFLPPGRLQSETKMNTEENFLQFRAEIETLLKILGIYQYKWNQQNKPYFHPHANLELSFDGNFFGEVGILHNRISDLYGLRKRPFLCSLDLEALLDILQRRETKLLFRVPSSLPQSSLDISLVLDERESSCRYASLVLKSGIPELDEVWVHDTFRGGNLGESKVSVTYRILLTPHDKNLTQERLREISDMLVMIAKENHFTLR